jgi:hypothetical protein
MEDVLQGLTWNTTRLKDRPDILRLIEAYPHLRERVPEEILARLN